MNPGAADVISDRTFTTPAFSPNDSLIFAAEQRFPGGSGQPATGPIPAVYAVNEQEGDNLTPTNSRIRWRFPVFNDVDATVQSTGRLSRTVETVTVDDAVPLVNYLNFHPQWPTVNSARKRATNVGSPVYSLRSTLTATGRCRAMSSARQTWPMPPAAISWCNS